MVVRHDFQQQLPILGEVQTFSTDNFNPRPKSFTNFKDEVEFWSCDCIVKGKVWKRQERVDHLTYISICVYCKVLESSK